MSSISDERGSELLYAGMPISQVFQEELGIGGVLGLLWFQKRWARVSFLIPARVSFLCSDLLRSYLYSSRFPTTSGGCLCEMLENLFSRRSIEDEQITSEVHQVMLEAQQVIEEISGDDQGRPSG